MSAILGIYRIDKECADEANLRKMLSSMQYRGPDGEGIWVNGPIGLGHLMLHTTPESLHERLPFEDGNLTITADARIDNRAELLASFSDCHENIPDSHLILRAYKEWGERCPEKLIGDFAFAIWDSRKKELFCARDHIGVKPFYYFLSDQAFIFASAIKGVLSNPEVPQRLNEEMVARYLLSSLDDREITFYLDVLRLPAAHILTLSKGSIRKKEYWSLDPKKEIRLSSDEEYAKEFRRIFTEAVNCRMRSVYSVGAKLSGGLDSSSVVCVARKLLSGKKTPLLTFSAVFPQVPVCDESYFIKAVTSQGDLKPFFIQADKLSPFKDIDDMLWSHDEPFGVPNLFWSWEICRIARDNEVRIMLDGADGDIVISHGFNRLTELAKSFRWMTLCSELKGFSEHSNIPYRRLLWRRCILPFIPNSAIYLWQSLRGHNNRDAIPKIFNPSFYYRVSNEFQSSCQNRQIVTTREDHYYMLTNGFIQYIMEVIDHLGASFSIDIRHPFYDKRLVEFCLALPADQKFRKGWSRWILRTAMEGILPPEIQWRGGKTNLSASYRYCLKKYDSALLEKVIQDFKTIADYVDISFLSDAYQKFKVQDCSMGSFNLWPPVSLAIWMCAKSNLNSGIISNHEKP